VNTVGEGATPIGLDEEAEWWCGGGGSKKGWEADPAAV